MLYNFSEILNQLYHKLTSLLFWLWYFLFHSSPIFYLLASIRSLLSTNWFLFHDRFYFALHHYVFCNNSYLVSKVNALRFSPYLKLRIIYIWPRYTTTKCSKNTDSTRIYVICKMNRGSTRLTKQLSGSLNFEFAIIKQNDII